MEKRILITCTDIMMTQVLIPHIINLSQSGYKVDVAISIVGNKFDRVKSAIGDYADNIYTVRLKRSPLAISNLKGLGDLKKIINGKKYDLVWTNEPVMGTMTRIASKKARKKGTKVMYMAHGFHFFKGAPKRNWLIFYPIEKHMAKRTDVIVTMNNEDFSIAKKFQSCAVEFVHGIGMNTARLSVSTEKNSIKKELGLSNTDFVLVSVGEVNDNKNHRVIINAISILGDNSIHYVICGVGGQIDNLRKLVIKKGVAENVHFLGYRLDAVDIVNSSDVFVMPSKREGLPVAAMEAMYCGLPLVVSNIRGLNDLVEDGVSGYTCNPNSPEDFADKIRWIKTHFEDVKGMGEINKRKVENYTLDKSKIEIVKLVEKVLG